MNELITSAQNSTVKRLRKLFSSAKARREESVYIAEGIHLVRSFLLSGGVPELYAYADSSLQNQEVAELVGTLSDTPAKRIVIADSLFESITHVHASVGIVILFTPHVPSTDSVALLTDTAVLLEDIQDPGNMGTILRTAAAVGAKTILLSPGCTSPWSPKALRAGMGAQFSLSIIEDANLVEYIKTAEIPVLATTLAAESTSLYTINLTQPIAWLFGNEGQGISSSLASAATTRVYIPQADTAVESLNVAAAAAVCLYEQYRQSLG